MNDEIFEGSEEFYGQLTSAESGVTITQSNATVYIIDEDGGCLGECVANTHAVTFVSTVVEIGFTQDIYIVEEGETAVLIVENTFPNTETEITVHVDFTDGRATGLKTTYNPFSFTHYILFCSSRGLLGDCCRFYLFTW